MASYRLLVNSRSILKATGLGLTMSIHHQTECNSFNGRNIEDVYDLLDNRPIGMGGFGVVCPGRHRVTGETVAIKSVSKTKMSEDKMLREAEIMRLCGDHHYVADFVDLFESDTHWYLIMEMASGGELFDRLITRGPYTEAHASVVIREITEALAYIHQQGVVHFDLKPENILIHSNRPDSSSGKGDGETTRITDFGSSFLLSEPIERRIPATGSGTSAYMAPEALVDEGERGPCGASADMWSLGLVMYIVLAGAHPFDLENNASDAEVEERILYEDIVLEGGNWDKVSTQGKDLLRQLLSKDPEERPSATQVLEHPWMIGGAIANKVPLEDVGENLRKFHRGRRRLKALLLATMLELGKHKDHSKVSTSLHDCDEKKGSEPIVDDDAKRRDHHIGDEDPLGSRLAALRVFDPSGSGVISAQDLSRVVKSLGDDLSQAEIMEMLRAADQNPRTTQKVIQPEQMLKLVPPLSPPKCYDYLGNIFQSGQTDPQAYLVTQGKVLLSFIPKHGGRSIPSRSVQRGGLIGDSELLSADGSVLPRLHSAQCISSDGCKVLAVGKDLFSHLTDVFESLGEDLSNRANDQLHATLAQWLKHAESSTSLQVAPGDALYPISSSTSCIHVKNKKGYSFWPSHLSWGSNSNDDDDTSLEECESCQKSHPEPSASRAATSRRWGSLAKSAGTSGCLVIIEQGECEVELETSPGSTSSISLQKQSPTSEEDITSKQEKTSVKRRVGPGFVCYCAPPRQLVSDRQVPPSLRSLPRCVKMNALSSEGAEHAGSDKVVAEHAGADKVVATAIAGQELHELLKQPGMSALREYVKELVTSRDAMTSDACQSVAISKCQHRRLTK